jgi:hypothetical protein
MIGPKKYSFEIDISSWADSGLIDAKPYWLGWDCAYAEGNSLDELLDNAQLTTSDQDGGEGPTYTSGDLSDAKFESLKGFIKDAMDKQHDRRRGKFRVISGLQSEG